MKKIILHIGTPKSGTSALQNFLSNNTEVFNKNGFSYPSDLYAEKNEITMGNGRIIYEYAMESNIIGARKYLDTILQEYDSDYIILSSEGFYFYPEFLFELMPDALVVVYFREQSETIVSSYGQRIKGNPSFQKTLPEYLDTILHGKENKMFTEYFLDKWKKYYNDIILRPYDFNQFIEGTIFTDFLHTIGISTFKDFILPKKKINLSYTRNALEYKLLINRLMKPDDIKINQLIRNLLQQFSESYPDKHKFRILTPQQKENITNYFKKCNSYIAHNYLHRMDGQLFYSKQQLKEEKNYDGLTINAIHDITRYLINQNPILLEIIVKLVISGLKNEKKQIQNAAYKLLPVFSLYKCYLFLNNNIILNNTKDNK